MKRLLLPASLALVSIGLIGTYAHSIWPQPMKGQPSEVATKTIDEKQAIGGQATGANTSPESEQATPPSVPKPAPTDDRSATIEKIAPRQAEIRDATIVEYEYRALRTSNDPLPQPAWVTNATKAQTAWDSATGNGVVIAVIDSGFALNHEDLTDQWHVNTAETGMTSSGDSCWTGTPANKASNNCDDDDNGYTDDWRGWDFVSVSNNPMAGKTNPNGAGVAHGTEVAGLVGATGNNGVGTATMSWNNKIMPLQGLSDDGSGYTSGIAAAVYYAVDNGAAVINMSLGGDTDDPTLAQAIRYAYDNDVVVVAAAGNCGTGNEQGCDPAKPGAMGYPALNPHVISVGATNSSNARASFSSYGPGLDVTAPGSGTLVSPVWLSDNQTSAYATTLYGTSFASPIVASYVGLIKSLRPDSTPNDITAIVNATASKPASMGSAAYTTQYGHGIIDGAAGLRVAAALGESSGVTTFMQTGDHRSEHSFSSNATLSSGCQTLPESYCTMWATNAAGYDRFLPYKLTNTSGQAGWSWTGSWLGSGDWYLTSRSGDYSGPSSYQLFSK